MIDGFRSSQSNSDITEGDSDMKTLSAVVVCAGIALGGVDHAIAHEQVDQIQKDGGSGIWTHQGMDGEMWDCGWNDWRDIPFKQKGYEHVKYMQTTRPDGAVVRTWCARCGV